MVRPNWKNQGLHNFLIQCLYSGPCISCLIDKRVHVTSALLGERLLAYLNGIHEVV